MHARIRSTWIDVSSMTVEQAECSSETVAGLALRTGTRGHGRLRGRGTAAIMRNKAAQRGYIAAGTKSQRVQCIGGQEGQNMSLRMNVCLGAKHGAQSSRWKTRRRRLFCAWHLGSNRRGGYSQHSAVKPRRSLYVKLRQKGEWGSGRAGGLIQIRPQHGRGRVNAPRTPRKWCGTQEVKLRSWEGR